MTQIKRMQKMNRIFYPCPLGVRSFENGEIKGIRIAYCSDSEDCGIVLYNIKTGKETARIPFDKAQRIGKVYYLELSDIDTDNTAYLFYEGDKLFADKRAEAFIGKGDFGEAKCETDYKASLHFSTFDWEDDTIQKLSYDETVVYGMHVRGFTRHASSGVKGKGTFAGIVEKIPYLKELGVTTIELQPAYEFNEKEKCIQEPEGKAHVLSRTSDKLNYWGYCEGYYYAPKREYSYSGNASEEFKYMVKELHKNGMELVMQFYFPKTISYDEILNILRFWHITYHVDGFHLKGENLPVQTIAEDGYLADCKLWYYYFPVEALYPNHEKPQYRNLATYNDGFMYDMRHLLKGDEGMLYEAMKHMRLNPGTHGVINYFTNYYGFTMNDLVSYEKKYNEENGENNKDGTDINVSWNCGAEGATRKKQVLLLRQKQIKNAFTLLMLSQGTPMFFMGDEFCNSQKGNNNPYCQDNEITWINWKDLNKNKEIFQYVKELIALRKACGVFHLPKECMIMDYLSCGYPDISYHGEEAWKPSWEHYNRHIGFMLCGDYVKDCKGKFYYVAINMHWEKQTFSLPKLPKGKEWKVLLQTGDKETIRIPVEKDKGIAEENIYSIEERSICIFVGGE